MTTPQMIILPFALIPLFAQLNVLTFIQLVILKPRMTRGFRRTSEQHVFYHVSRCGKLRAGRRIGSLFSS